MPTNFSRPQILSPLTGAACVAASLGAFYLWYSRKLAALGYDCSWNLPRIDFSVRFALVLAIGAGSLVVFLRANRHSSARLILIGCLVALVAVAAQVGLWLLMTADPHCTI